MDSHLSDEHLAQALLEAAPSEAREHLESCAACRSDWEVLHAGVAALRQQTRADAERPASFWTRQRAAISARLEERASGGLWRFAYAGALALLVLAAILLSPQAPPRTPVAQTDPDHALLVDVERSVRRELPRALEPAALLTQEMSRTTEAQLNP